MPHSSDVHRRVDRHVGAQLRRLRIEQGWSQTVMGRRLGCSFQQVQKYENATNRLTASRLHAAALAFEKPIQVFFDGLEVPKAPVPDDKLTAASIRNLRAIATPGIRRQASALVESLKDLDRLQRTDVVIAAE